jgi:hypothetical protein
VVTSLIVKGIYDDIKMDITVGVYGMGFVRDSIRGGPREHSSEILGFTKGV